MILAPPWIGALALAARPVTGIITPPAFSTWNPADKTAEIGLTAGNLIATVNSTAAITSGVRGTAGHSTGAWHFELTFGGAIAAFAVYPLYGTAALALNMANGSYSATNNGMAAQFDGRVFFNNVNVGMTDVPVAGDTMAVEMDFTAAQMFVQKLGGTGRKGPFSFAGIVGTQFPILNAALLGPIATLNVGASAFLLPVTGGFSPWG